jgi:hypothetical protein
MRRALLLLRCPQLDAPVRMAVKSRLNWAEKFLCDGTYRASATMRSAGQKITHLRKPFSMADFEKMVRDHIG